MFSKIVTIGPEAPDVRDQMNASLIDNNEKLKIRKVENIILKYKF